MHRAVPSVDEVGEFMGEGVFEFRLVLSRDDVSAALRDAHFARDVEIESLFDALLKPRPGVDVDTPFLGPTSAKERFERTRMPMDLDGAGDAAVLDDGTNGGGHPGRAVAIKNPVERPRCRRGFCVAAGKSLHDVRPVRRLSPVESAPFLAPPRSMESPARCPTSCPDRLV